MRPLEVMIVEDDPHQLKNLKMNLELDGWVVKDILVQRPKEEMQNEIDAKLPGTNLVITDIGLGVGYTGVDVLDQIRRKSAELPVIGMTGGDVSRLYETRSSEHREVWFDEVLAKPFSHSLLEGVIEKLKQEWKIYVPLNVGLVGLGALGTGISEEILGQRNVLSLTSHSDNYKESDQEVYNSVRCEGWDRYEFVEELSQMVENNPDLIIFSRGIRRVGVIPNEKLGNIPSRWEQADKTARLVIEKLKILRRYGYEGIIGMGSNHVGLNLEIAKEMGFDPQKIINPIQNDSLRAEGLLKYAIKVLLQAEEEKRNLSGIELALFDPTISRKFIKPKEGEVEINGLSLYGQHDNLFPALDDVEFTYNGETHRLKDYGILKDAFDHFRELYTQKLNGMGKERQRAWERTLHYPRDSIDGIIKTIDSLSRRETHPTDTMNHYIPQTYRGKSLVQDSFSYAHPEIKYYQNGDVKFRPTKAQPMSQSERERLRSNELISQSQIKTKIRLLKKAGVI